MIGPDRVRQEPYRLLALCLGQDADETGVIAGAGEKPDAPAGAVEHVVHQTTNLRSQWSAHARIVPSGPAFAKQKPGTGNLLGGNGRGAG